MGNLLPNQPVLELYNVVRTFTQADVVLPILKEISLKIFPGQIVGLMGQSGAGKSTLLHLAGLLEAPDQGEIFIKGKNCRQSGEKERTLTRRTSIGFVYQFHHLLPDFSALENLMLPQMICGLPAKVARVRAKELLEMVGLSHRLNHRPARLSGGEQQRVAIARAVANRPSLLLADEPTGNLDPVTANEVFTMLVGLVHTCGLAALIATHNPDLASRMDKTYVLKEGVLQPL